MALLQRDGSLIASPVQAVQQPLPAPVVRAVDHGCKVEAGRFLLDRHDCSVTLISTGKVIELTRFEFKLLDVLMRNAHQAVARDVLYEQVWKVDPGYTSNCLDVTVNYLRRKLGARAILTVRGFGYQFNSAFDVA